MHTAAVRATVAAMVVLSFAFSGCMTSTSESSGDKVDPPYVASLLRGVEGRVSLRIHYVDGFMPSSLALDALNQTIHETTGKIVTIDYWNTFPRQGDTSTLASMEAAKATAIASEQGVADSGVSLRLLYLNGNAEDGHTGRYLPDGTLVLFLEPWDGYTPGGISIGGTGFNQFRPLVERSLLIHELGHAYGLVHCGIPMTVPREDPSSPCHSVQNDSVMRADIVEVTGNPQQASEGDVSPVWHFNEADIHDIKSYQAMS